MTALRRIAEHLLVALVLGLPFEYYFASRDQSLATSLKLQLGLWLVGWIALRGTNPVRALRDIARAVPRRLFLAVVLFVLVHAAAAALARDERSNAARAAAKTALGALVLVAAADLTRGALHGRDRLAARLLGALAGGGTVAGAVGLGAFAGVEAFRDLADLFQPERFFVGPHERFSSPMEYPNTAASLLAASLFASLALAGDRRSAASSSARFGLRPGWRGIILWLACIGLLSLSLILTYSRGAVGAAMCAILLAAWYGGRAPADSGVKRLAGAAILVLCGGMAVIGLREAAPQAALEAAHQRTARFGLPGNGSTVRSFPAGREVLETISVRNDSEQLWRRGGFGIAYRWYDLRTRGTTQLQHAATFEADVAPGQVRTVAAALATPSQAGEYLLIWFVFQRDAAMVEIEKSFSAAVTCVVHGAGGEPVPPLSDEARQHRRRAERERREVAASAFPTRRELWRAAIRMALEHPLTGVGPDNFRLLKWRYMDVPAGDESILANSLYLETLAGAGLPGLAALLLLLYEVGRLLAQAQAGTAVVTARAFTRFGLAFFAGVAIHGLVDYFLKFTPTFLLFWIVLGALSGHGSRTAEPEAAP